MKNSTLLSNDYCFKQFQILLRFASAKKPKNFQFEKHTSSAFMSPYDVLYGIT